MLRKIVTLLLISISLVSCNNTRVKNVCKELIYQKIAPKGISIEYPKKNTLFPIDFQSPTFVWHDSSTNNSNWYACISDTFGNIILNEFVKETGWKTDSSEWEHLKRDYISKPLLFSVIGYNKKNNIISGCTQSFKISKDSVGADIFFRAVTLPFSYAVHNVNTIEWYMGNVSGGAPSKMLDNMPVCANCHSFSKNGPTLAMDVDYGNDKGSYAIALAKDTSNLKPENIISWSNFKAEEGDPTFGLLSQISPSGKYILSTVKDLSVFVAVDDNLAYSQLFFPIKGIIGIYDRETNTFAELQGANNPKYVQSNPIWSPDNKKVLFARTTSYINEKVKKYGNALLNINDVQEFKTGNKQFKFDIYSVDFNEGKGGTAQSLKNASFNEKSNYFPKYSPDGKWIVFCQADNFMLLQPDSKLYIMNADGTNNRMMNCNMGNMNSWHSWSPNGHWLVFSSKEQSLYTRLYLTHIDEHGNDSPPILLENLVFDKRAANIPEFFPGKANDFKKIKDDFSNTAPYFTRLASDNIKSELFIRADQNLKHAISLDPNYIDAYLLRILLNSILQQVNSKSERAEKAKALSIVTDLVRKNGEDKELQLLKASLLSANGDYNQAEEVLHSIITEEPQNYKAYELLAGVYKKKNKTDQVISVYNKMKILVPANSLEISLLMARYYLTHNQINSALQLLRKLSDQYPAYEDLHIELCNVYIGMKDRESAQSEINLLFKMDSTNYNYYYMGADISENAGEKNKVVEYKKKGNELLQRKFEQNKENIPLAFKRASILIQNKNYNQAVEVYNSVLSVLPSNYQALKEKARIMILMQQWQDAVRLYEYLLSIYNPEEEFYNNAAIANIKMGNFESALDHFTNALKLNPSNIDALFNRAKLYEMMGNKEKEKIDIEMMKQVLKSKKNLTESEKQLLKI